MFRLRARTIFKPRAYTGPALWSETSAMGGGFCWGDDGKQPDIEIKHTAWDAMGRSFSGRRWNRGRSGAVGGS